MSSLERLAGATGTAAAVVAPPASLRTQKYGEDRLHLLVRDPHRVLAIWELSPALAERAAARASSVGAPLRSRLRIEQRRHGDPEGSRVTAFADLPDAQGGESWYFDLSDAGGEARATLGLDLPGTFEPLLVSRWSPLPPDRSCAEEGPGDLAAGAAAWLDRQANLSRALDRIPSPSSVSRYLISPERPKS